MGDWMDHIVDIAEQQGFRFRQTRRGAWLVTDPDGDTATFQAPRSLVDCRHLADELRRRGLRVPVDGDG